MPPKLVVATTSTVKATPPYDSEADDDAELLRSMMAQNRIEFAVEVIVWLHVVV